MNRNAPSLFMVLALVGFSMGGQAQGDVAQRISYVMCKNRKIVRTIRVETSGPGSCQTIYTKAGVDRVVGQGTRKDSCLGYLNNIKGNLGKASWKCKDLSKSSITSSE